MKKRLLSTNCERSSAQFCWTVIYSPHILFIYYDFLKLLLIIFIAIYKHLLSTTQFVYIIVFKIRPFMSYMLTYNETETNINILFVIRIFFQKQYHDFFALNIKNIIRCSYKGKFYMTTDIAYSLQFCNRSLQLQ